MSGQNNLAAQLQNLLTTLERQGNLHLSEVDADLRQTNDLLVQAIGKLGKGFIGIHESVAAQQAAIASVQDGATMTPQVRAEIARLQRITDAHINTAVTALQFQDMTSQLLGRVAGHVEGLREVLNAVGEHGAALDTDASDPAALAALDSVNIALAEKSIQQDAVARKAVAQTHMESGDIELF